MARFFFALDLSPSDKAAIAELQQIISPALPKPTATENLHLTLAFLGNISAQQVDTLICEATQLSTQYSTPLPYSLTVDHLGVFTRAKVLYLGLANVPSWLHSLATQLEKAAKLLNIEIDERAYHPHITISRKVKVAADPIDIQLTLSIKSFSLYESTSGESGVMYTPIKTFTISNK